MAEPQLPETACEGVVRRVLGARVFIEFDAAGHCAACASQARCAFAPESGRLLEVTAAGFEAGERVLVHTDPRAAMRLSLMLILVPALLVLVGAFAGYSAAELYAPGHGEMGSLVGVVAGLLLGYTYVHFAGRLSAPPAIRVERLQ